MTYDVYFNDKLIDSGIKLEQFVERHLKGVSLGVAKLYKLYDS